MKEEVTPQQGLPISFTATPFTWHVSIDGISILFPQESFFVAFNPNQDLHDLVRFIDKRAGQMLPIVLALMAIVSTSQSLSLIVVSGIFFFITFLFYFISYIGTPGWYGNISHTEAMRKCEIRLYTQDPAILTSTVDDLRKIASQHSELRSFTQKAYNRKMTLLRLAHSFFFSFVAGALLLTLTARLNIFTDITNIALLSLLMASFAGIIYLIQSASYRKV